MAQQIMKETGRRVKLLAGGFHAWRRHGLPLEDEREELPKTG